MSNLVIVAIPDENDRVWKVSSEKVPHLTLLFLGDADKVANADQITQFVEHAANTTLKRFYLPVDHRGELGADKADVLFFKKNRWDFRALHDFRSNLLKDDNIRTAYDSADQFEGSWKPHLTLGYPATPAKPEDNDYGNFYDVSFNRVAVWFGNYEGPEFLLPDHWDDWDSFEAMPLDVAMSGIQRHGADPIEQSLELGGTFMAHFGIPGMHWGQRKSETITTDDGGTQQVTAKEAQKADANWEKDFKSQKSFPGFDDEKFTADYNDKWKDHDFSKEDWSNPSESYQKYQDGYFTAMSHEYTKQLVDHYGSSPTGKLKVEKTGNADEIRIVHSDRVQHADETWATFKIAVNDQGKITGVTPVEDSMTQTTDLDKSLTAGSEFLKSLGLDPDLEHHGVKGMRWGVRKSDTASGITPGSAAKAVGSGAKTAAKGVGKGVGGVVKLGLDVQFENKATDGRARNEVISEASKTFKKEHLPKIKAKPEYQEAKKLKNRLRHPRDPMTKAYRKEARETYIKQLETTANSKTNASGTRQYTIRERGVELPAGGSTKLPSSKTYWDVSTRKVEHAGIKDTDPFTRLEVVMDEDGFITDLKPVPIEDSIAQSVDLGAHFLASVGLVDEDEIEHYGVKGMRWGVRGGSDGGSGTSSALSLRSREAPTAVAPQATSKVPHGDKRKTRLKVEGGQNHEAHDDAIHVAEAKAKLKKSGTAALSNKELRDVATRVQLEQQVTQLTSSPGRKFISGLLKNQGNQAANKVVQKKVNSKIG